jgi:hypothetical protein
MGPVSGRACVFFTVLCAALFVSVTDGCCQVCPENFYEELALIETSAESKLHALNKFHRHHGIKEIPIAHTAKALAFLDTKRRPQARQQPTVRKQQIERFSFVSISESSDKDVSFLQTSVSSAAKKSAPKTSVSSAAKKSAPKKKGPQRERKGAKKDKKGPQKDKKGPQDGPQKNKKGPQKDKKGSQKDKKDKDKKSKKTSQKAKKDKDKKLKKASDKKKKADSKAKKSSDKAKKSADKKAKKASDKAKKTQKAESKKSKKDAKADSKKSKKDAKASGGGSSKGGSSKGGSDSKGGSVGGSVAAGIGAGAAVGVGLGGMAVASSLMKSGKGGKSGGAPVADNVGVTVDPGFSTSVIPDTPAGLDYQQGVTCCPLCTAGFLPDADYDKRIRVPSGSSAVHGPEAFLEVLEGLKSAPLHTAVVDQCCDVCPEQNYNPRDFMDVNEFLQVAAGLDTKAKSDASKSGVKARSEISTNIKKGQAYMGTQSPTSYASVSGGGSVRVSSVDSKRGKSGKAGKGGKGGGGTLTPVATGPPRLPPSPINIDRGKTPSEYTGAKGVPCACRLCAEAMSGEEGVFEKPNRIEVPMKRPRNGLNKRKYD